VRDAQAALGKDAVVKLAAPYGLIIKYISYTGGDLRTWIATAVDARDPRISAEVHSSNDAAAVDFAITRQRMNLIHSIP
jgi:hypothetical protein